MQERIESKKEKCLPDTRTPREGRLVTAGSCLRLLVLSACLKAKFQEWKMLFMVWLCNRKFSSGNLVDFRSFANVLFCSCSRGLTFFSPLKKWQLSTHQTLSSVCWNMFGSCGMISPDMKQHFPSCRNFLLQLQKAFSTIWPKPDGQGTHTYMGCPLRWLVASMGSSMAKPQQVTGCDTLLWWMRSCR